MTLLQILNLTRKPQVRVQDAPVVRACVCGRYHVTREQCDRCEGKVLGPYAQAVIWATEAQAHGVECDWYDCIDDGLEDEGESLTMHNAGWSDDPRHSETTQGDGRTMRDCSMGYPWEPSDKQRSLRREIQVGAPDWDRDHVARWYLNV
jgi:hypothetical protein